MDEELAGPAAAQGVWTSRRRADTQSTTVRVRKGGKSNYLLDLSPFLTPGTAIVGPEIHGIDELPHYHPIVNGEHGGHVWF
jgi:hypothetical protein